MVRGSWLDLGRYVIATLGNQVSAHHVPAVVDLRITYSPPARRLGMPFDTVQHQLNIGAELACRGRADLVTPDYMVGYSGVAMTLLRLADPRQRPRQLSIAGFRLSRTSSD